MIPSLITALSSIAQVHRGYLWLDQINDFPMITFQIDERNLSHISANIRYYLANCTLRAYVKDENSQSASDELAQRIEEVLMGYSDRSNGVEEVRVTTISTDEGQMNPYGVVDMRFQILYQQKLTI